MNDMGAFFLLLGLLFGLLLGWTLAFLVMAARKP